MAPRNKAREDDERFGKSRNEDPPDPLNESANIADELPREVGASEAELETPENQNERFGTAPARPPRDDVGPRVDDSKSKSKR